VEPERRWVGERQQRPAALPDVEIHGRGDQVRDAPLGARHHVQRPHAPLHGHGHQHLARRRPPAGSRPRGVSSSSRVAAAVHASSPEASFADAGEQVRVRPGPLPQQQAIALLLGPATTPVERRRPLRQRLARRRQRPRVPRLPRPGPGLLIRRRRDRRHRRDRSGVEPEPRSDGLESPACYQELCNLAGTRG
jgi:hypothetical protein